MTGRPLLLNQWRLLPRIFPKSKCDDLSSPQFPQWLQDTSKSKQLGRHTKLVGLWPLELHGLALWRSAHTSLAPAGFLHSAFVIFLQALECTSLSGIQAFRHALFSPWTAFSALTHHQDKFCSFLEDAVTPLPSDPPRPLPAWSPLTFLHPGDLHHTYDEPTQARSVLPAIVSAQLEGVSFTCCTPRA